MTNGRKIFHAHTALGASLILFCTLGVTERIASQEQKSTQSSKAAGRVEPSDADGKQVFESRCAGCHGLDGRGAERAPDIALNAKTQRRSDEELVRIIQRGLPETGMPSFASLGSNIENVIAYLRQLQGKNGATKVPGNTQNGHELFYGKARCSECHAVAGTGGFIGADLTVFGRNRSPDEIREAIIKPSTANRLGGMMIVKLRDGQAYSGVVRNEDNFSLQLQSLDGGFHLFQKSEVSSFSRQPDSLMPADYAVTLTPAELNDLISFLMFTAQDSKSEAAPTKRDDDE